MRQQQTLHEELIPLLVKGIGAESYLEFGICHNYTIAKVKCDKRYGVDTEIHPYFKGITMFHMTTAEFIRDHAAKYAKYDVVFIDADHSAGGAKTDFFGIIDYVTDEGLVILHDTNPRTLADTSGGLCGDAWKFAKELWNDGYEAVTLPYHPGLTIIRNRKVWGPLEA